MMVYLSFVKLRQTNAENKAPTQYGESEEVNLPPASNKLTLLKNHTVPANRLNGSTLFALAFGILFTLAACGGGGGGGSSSSDAIATGERVHIDGTVKTVSAKAVGYKPVSGNGVSYAAYTDNQIADGNIIVITVDSDSNVTSTITDENKNFSLSVANDKSYVIMFVNSATEYVGTLFLDDRAKALAVTADIDLGTS